MLRILASLVLLVCLIVPSSARAGAIMPGLSAHNADTDSGPEFGVAGFFAQMNVFGISDDGLRGFLAVLTIELPFVSKTVDYSGTGSSEYTFGPGWASLDGDILGNPFGPDEYDGVVLGHGTWRGQFGGFTLRLRNENYNPGGTGDCDPCGDFDALLGPGEFNRALAKYAGGGRRTSRGDFHLYVENPSNPYGDLRDVPWMDGGIGLQSVPEPSSLSLSVLAVGALFARFRRR